MANEAKQFTIGGVTHDVMDVGARQLITQLQAAIDAITSGDTTTAIKTFQEVINFLDGVTDDATLIGKLNELRTLIAAKYSKPASGIPASDLADGVIPDVSGFATKTEVNAKANSADVYTKTEVDDKVAEAGKVKSVSVNNGTPAQPDGNGNVNIQVQTGSTISPATVAPSMDGTAAVGSSAKYAREDHVHPKDTSKQDKLTFDNVPTAGSNNPVKSGGIKTAIDQVTPTIDANGKWVIGGVATDKDAQGPRGNSILVNENAQSIQALIVNNVVDGGETDILSAEMGKVIRQNIMKIFNALGNYAFPDGKPVIDWGGSSSVTYSVTYPTDSKITHTGAGDTVELGSLLEVTLGIASGNDLYVIKDSSVKVYMSGVEQSGAYNSSTQKVTISAVTGNVIIVAEAWTYVSRGLVMHLDGRNRGGTAGKWKSLVDYNNSPLYFKLENCDEQSDYVAGNGTSSKGTAFSDSGLTTPVTLLDVGAAEGTIEAAYGNAELASNGNLCIMHNALGTGNRICLMSWKDSRDADKNQIVMRTSGTTIQGSSYKMPNTSIVNGNYMSFLLGSLMLDGIKYTTASEYGQVTNEASLLSIFYRKCSSEQYFKLRLYALRVYSVQLTDEERDRNYAIDKKRFNL